MTPSLTPNSVSLVSGIVLNGSWDAATESAAVLSFYLARCVCLFLQAMTLFRVELVVATSLVFAVRSDSRFTMKWTACNDRN